MNRAEAVEAVIAYIDSHIKGALSLPLLAEQAGYSPYHFSRMFTQTVGVSVMAYVTWRKLQFALFDLSQGRKVIDVAMDYGFETHGGFIKAFVHWFSFPPSLCHPRLKVRPPAPASIHMLEHKFLGGHAMNPHIIELTPFSVVGYPSRHTHAKLRRTADAPTFWNTISMDYGTVLSKLYRVFTKSKHFEVSVCYDVDEGAGAFSYMLGRGIDNPEDLAAQEPDMTRLDMPGGLYAVFSTPPAAGSYVEAAQETWNEIFLNWLPQSEFEYDDTRLDFEYHDHRDHGWYFGGKLQIDICIPIRQREEEMRKSQLRASR